MTACPSGWRLPSAADWDMLAEAAGGLSVAGKNLKSASGWNANGNGTDAYGFTALPGGRRESDGRFTMETFHGSWWSTEENGSEYIYYRDMMCTADQLLEFSAGRFAGNSVRCVKN
jgi:uncharacterized protein (TIGR02145 family)